MAVLRIVQPPMITPELYDRVNATMGAEESPPDGLLMHSAGIVGDVFQIVDVWESTEHAQRFDRDRLGPAMAEVMGGAPPGPARRRRPNTSCTA
jgi:hypothetical protein